MKHGKQIIVNCWKCGKAFDIVSAKRCYEHLENYWGIKNWTTKCSHCGTCMCHKIEKMQDIKCKVLNEVGIMKVMPSVKRELSVKQNKESVV